MNSHTVAESIHDELKSRTNFQRAVLATLVAALSVGLLAGPALATTKSVVVVKTHVTTSNGTILVNTKGYAIYTYGADTKNHSNCAGSCLAIWPAVTVAKGVTPIGTGVSGLGYIVRSNGTYQVTWKGKPLYLFASDHKPGVVTGQGVANFSVAVAKKKMSTTTTTVASGGYNY